MVLHHRSFGTGPTVLLVHGAAEDAGLLTPQAEAIAATGRSVVVYDRRGTGASTRDAWPGDGADQHADDAAELLARLGCGPATVVGFSSGGVIAMVLAVRHPGAVAEAIAWEPAAVSVLEEGRALHEQFTAPLRRHLAARPGDWPGAWAVMLDTLSGGNADHGDPMVVRMRRNAEPAVRDDAERITLRPFGPELGAAPVTIAVGAGPDPLHLAIAERLAALSGRPVERVASADDHEVYLSRPEVLAQWLADRR
jgi:pimeloyl-ACP methyl ester carboxylesterase